MSKFTVKIELQGLKIEVEGTHENAPRLAQRVGEQIGALVKPPLLAEMNKSGSSNVETDEPAEDRKTKRKKPGGGGSKASADDVTFTHDPSQHGGPSQEWTTVQKAIWLLCVADPGRPLSGYSIAKAFNKQFKSAGAINAGNVNKGLEKERLKGTSSTVGADLSDGTTRYYLTDTGKSMGAQLAKGIAA